MGDATDKDGFELSATRRTLPIALLRAREQIMDRFRPMLQRHGVTEQQWRVLRVLYEAPDTDMGALGAAASILGPSLSRMTRGLEDRGLIEVRRDPGDGRRARLRLSEAGTTLIHQVTPESAAIYAEIEQRVGRERIESLLDGLEALLRDLGDDAQTKDAPR